MGKILGHALNKFFTFSHQSQIVFIFRRQLSDYLTCLARASAKEDTVFLPHLYPLTDSFPLEKHSNSRKSCLSGRVMM